MNLLVKPLSRWIYDNDLSWAHKKSTKKEIFLGLKIGGGVILCMNIPYPSFSGEILGKKPVSSRVTFLGNWRNTEISNVIDWNWFHWLPATVSSSPWLQISWSNSLGDISPWTKPEMKVLKSNSELLNCHVSTSDLVVTVWSVFVCLRYDWKVFQQR